MSNNESFNDEQLADDEDSSEEDERPDSVDEKIKKREKRKGLDLATTLERIEKNFVITDPRLPDNPIVRKFIILFFYIYDHLCCFCTKIVIGFDYLCGMMQLKLTYMNMKFMMVKF